MTPLAPVKLVGAGSPTDEAEGDGIEVVLGTGNGTRAFLNNDPPPGGVQPLEAKKKQLAGESEGAQQVNLTDGDGVRVGRGDGVEKEL